LPLEGMTNIHNKIFV